MIALWLLVGLIAGMHVIEWRDRRDARIRAELQQAMERARIAAVVRRAFAHPTAPKAAHDMPALDQMKLGAINTLLFVHRQTIRA